MKKQVRIAPYAMGLLVAVVTGAANAVGAVYVLPSEAIKDPQSFLMLASWGGLISAGTYCMKSPFSAGDGDDE